MRLSALLPAFVLVGLLLGGAVGQPASDDSTVTRLTVTPIR